MSQHSLLDPIRVFLQCPTPDAWIEEARKPGNLSIILRDHLLCELKAAQSAAFLLKRYAITIEAAKQLSALIEPYELFAYKKLGSLSALKTPTMLSKSLQASPGRHYGQDMINKMVLLIKEELHHFYQVAEMMAQHQIPNHPINASRYAKGMIKHLRTYEPEALVDKLIIGAFIEARSCERFAKLAPHLPPTLNQFYLSLLRSEARHYQDYLALATQISNQDIQPRIDFYASVEAQLIQTEDEDFKFHSGIPAGHL